MYDKFAKISRSGLKMMDIKDISILLGLSSPSARVIATRMVRGGILQRLRRDLYLLNGVETNDFEIANRLIEPSYVSFESAMNYWGITTQIPEAVTSAAMRSRSLNVMAREFSFSNLPKNLFHFGIRKEAAFFIAEPEKTLLDMIYYASLGKRSVTFDALNTRKIDRARFFSYGKRYPGRTQKLARKILA